jgi:hypothetical protein
MRIGASYGMCVWCHRRLHAIGHSRSNGADHKDWRDRTSHKKCWIENELKKKLPRPIK